MLRPYFLESKSGRVFIQSFVPDITNNEVVIFVPPFAEEMNKSRRMMALLGQQLASNGVHMLIPDLYGTGDSEGDFSEANWDIWLDNLGQIIQGLSQDGKVSISLVGLRMGCLLIHDFLQTKSALPIHKVVFWKPVIFGQQMINQFLRLRIANSMMSGTKETTASLRENLHKDGVLEVAGYGLNVSLISSLDEKRLLADNFDESIDWSWFEVVANDNQPTPLASSKLVAALNNRHIPVRIQNIVGESFWSNQEIAEVAALITATCDVLGRESEAL